MSRCLTIGWDELFSEARKVGVIRTNHLLYQGKGSQKIIARNVSFWWKVSPKIHIKNPIFCGMQTGVWLIVRTPYSNTRSLVFL